MINPNELRRGNKVISKTHNLANATLEGLTAHNLVFLKEVTTCEVLQQLEPIPLTPEILEKAGFVWNETISFWVNCDRAGLPEFIKYSEGVFLWQRGKSRYKEIKYLHQLQNLYHALTGLELTINFE